jgi:hypothetical protein
MGGGELPSRRRGRRGDVDVDADAEDGVVAGAAADAPPDNHDRDVSASGVVRTRRELLAEADDDGVGCVL